MTDYQDVRLTDAEIVRYLGDADLSDIGAMRVVNAARARERMRAERPDLTPQQAGLLADLVRYAQANGRVKFQRRPLKGDGRCVVCGASPGFVPYQSGPRKGQPNRKRPRLLTAVEFADYFVSFDGRIALGCCMDCFGALRDEIVRALDGVRAEIPEELTGHPPRWRCFDRRRCSACGWEGHEGEMGMVSTLTGRTYPGKCPACGKQDLGLGSTVIEEVNGWVLVEQGADDD